VIAVDILHLIDRLEEEISQGQRLPFTHLVLLDEQRLWKIIDSMRISIPEEVRRAQQMERERERIMAQVQEEAGRVVELARQQAEEMISSHILVQDAEVEAERIVSQARSEAQRLQADADAYVLEVMENLKAHLERVLQVVQNGMELLTERTETAGDGPADGAVSREDASTAPVPEEQV